VNDVLLLDVTPLSLGVETMGGVMTPLIERNTTIPVHKTEVFSTAEDNQPAVDIHVVQGERPLAVDNMSLGRFRLDGIAPSPRGLPQIEVTFDIDANGILNVTARDKATGKEQKVTITASTNLNKGEIDRMVNEALKNQAADAQRKELVEARNNGDNAAYQAEKTLRDLDGKVQGNIRSEVEGKINALRQAIQGNDINNIRSLTQGLLSTMSSLSQPANTSNSGPYSGHNGGTPQNPQGEQPGNDGEGEVIEGEFREA
jgi:molecular chaperone DnaK